MLGQPRGHFTSTVGLITAAVIALSAPLRAADAATVFQTVAPSVVLVEALGEEGPAQGSGVVVAPGLVVTNHHVVKGTKSYVVVRQAARSWKAEVDLVAADKDLALLSIVTKRNERFDLPVVKRRPVKSLKVGERVYAVGSPQGLERTLSDGLVSGLPSLGPNFSLVQTTAAISPGSSGGGLFDEKGVLVGITTLYLEDSQSLNFAIPTDYIDILEDRLKSPSLERIELPSPAVASPPVPPAATAPASPAAMGIFLPVPIHRAKGVVLRATASGPVAEDGGIGQDWILARAAATLRAAGLSVFPSQDAALKAKVIAPTMEIELSSMHIENSVYFPWSLDVSVYDYAEFTDRKRRPVSIWSTGTHGFGGSEVVTKQVARAIDRLVEEFVQDRKIEAGPAPLSQ